MLPPPPPQTAFAQALAHIFHPSTTAIPVIRCAIFLVKAISLFVPCAPFVASPWLLYPLLALAAADLGVLSFRWDTSWTLLTVHLGVVYVAGQRGKLCEGERVAWDDGFG
jgi:hypothetical protein